MTALTADALVTSSDRLSLTLCLAILLHAILILGVSFVPPVHELPSFETMEIVLVNSRAQETPEDPQLLAQANQVGGGNEEKDVRPATPLATPVPAAVQAVPMAMIPTPEPYPPTPAIQSPQPQAQEVVEPRPIEETVPALPAEETAAATQELVAQAERELERQLSEAPAADRELSRQEKPASKTEPEPQHEPEEAKLTAAEHAKAAAAPSAPAPSGTALIARSFEIASLDAEIAERMEVKAKRPRRKFISATTAEYKYAAYMEAWRAKVERIGNLNYPDEARRDRLSGSLILDVALNADGSVNEITVRRPSGFPVLDDAAIRIVNLAAPYAPFPDEFNREVDILHITRTWQFKSGARFASQ